MDERKKQLDDALAMIEINFGRKTPTKEEFVNKLIERGAVCVTCRKVGCGCDCKCKACWGKDKFNTTIAGQ